MKRQPQGKNHFVMSCRKNVLNCKSNVMGNKSGEYGASKLPRVHKTATQYRRKAIGTAFW